MSRKSKNKAEALLKKLRPKPSAASGPKAAQQPKIAAPSLDFTSESAALTERRKVVLINIAYWAFVLALIYVVVKYVLAYIAPFVIGIVIAAALYPVVRWVSGKIKMNRTGISVLVVAVFYSTIGLLFVVGVVALITRLSVFLTTTYARYFDPASEEYVIPLITAWFDRVGENFQMLEPDIRDTIDIALGNLLASLGDLVSSFTNTTVGGLTSLLSSISSIVVGLIFTIIATFFISADYPRITGFLMAQVSERTAGLLRDIKRYLGEVLWQFAKSYSIILLMTYMELVVGFALLGVFKLLVIPNLMMVALFIAVLDIMPVLGLGAVLIPWGIISLVSGRTGAGVGMLILYLVTLVVRNIVEPKIVGQGVGLPAVVTLFSMYVGAQLFGVLGLFALPVAAAIIKSLNDKGAVALYKNPKSD